MEAPRGITQETRLSSVDQLPANTRCRVGSLKGRFKPDGHDSKSSARYYHIYGLLPTILQLEVEKLLRMEKEVECWKVLLLRRQLRYRSQKTINVGSRLVVLLLCPPSRQWVRVWLLRKVRDLRLWERYTSDKRGTFLAGVGSAELLFCGSRNTNFDIVTRYHRFWLDSNDRHPTDVLPFPKRTHLV